MSEEIKPYDVGIDIDPDTGEGSLYDPLEDDIDYANLPRVEVPYIYLIGKIKSTGVGYAKYNGDPVRIQVLRIKASDPNEVMVTAIEGPEDAFELNDATRRTAPIINNIALVRFAADTQAGVLRIDFNDEGPVSGLLKVYPKFHLSRLLGHIDVELEVE